MNLIWENDAREVDFCWDNPKTCFAATFRGLTWVDYKDWKGLTTTCASGIGCRVFR